VKLAPKNTPFRLTLGQRGEMAAWRFLIREGYKILDKNYQCKLGEIDVVAEQGGRIRFIEIKTRTSNRFGSPEEAVHPIKQKKLSQLASFYLKGNQKTDSPVSFDVVAVYWNAGAEPEIKIIQDAFLHEEDI